MRIVMNLELEREFTGQEIIDAFKGAADAYQEELSTVIDNKAFWYQLWQSATFEDERMFVAVGEDCETEINPWNRYGKVAVLVKNYSVKKSAIDQNYSIAGNSSAMIRVTGEFRDLFQANLNSMT